MCIKMMLVLREREEEKRDSEIFNKRNTQKGNYKTIPCWRDTVKYSANGNTITAHGGVYCHTLYIADGW